MTICDSFFDSQRNRLGQYATTFLITDDVTSSYASVNGIFASAEKPSQNMFKRRLFNRRKKPISIASLAYTTPENRTPKTYFDRR